MSVRKLLYIILPFVTLFLTSCKKDWDDDIEHEYLKLQAEADEYMSGGETTRFIHSVEAFEFSAPNITRAEKLRFSVGNSLFEQSWVTAPASTRARDGLGPLFNSRSCAGCHFKDGRGRPPKSANEFGTGMLLRLSIGNNPVTGPMPDPNYGGQLQDRSILGIPTEATFRITYKYIDGKYPDGTPYQLRKPTFHIENKTQGPLVAQFISPRIANQMIGLGLLEAIPKSTLLKNVDENDDDNDGISGRANYVWDIVANKTALGRFGWKANQPNIKQQVAAAFSGDMGLTSSIFPNENIPPSHKNIPIASGGNPEVDDVALNDVTLYSSVLAVPSRRNWKAQDILQGKQLFNKINCSACHIPKFTTGDTHPIKALRNQTIRPYTDLLLHDMGEGLSDNSPDFLATGSEWRTPPLWGVGLIEIVNKHQLLLHDGRARGIEEAILWHGGEAEKSKQEFMELKKEERNKIIAFINTL